MGQSAVAPPYRDRHLAGSNIIYAQLETLLCFQVSGNHYLQYGVSPLLSTRAMETRKSFVCNTFSSFRKVRNQVVDSRALISTVDSPKIANIVESLPWKIFFGRIRAGIGPFGWREEHPESGAKSSSARKPAQNGSV